MSHAQSSPQELSKGTDRAALHVYDPIASHPCATLSQHVGERAGVKENGNTTTRRRSKSAGVKAKIRKIFHHGPESHGDSQETPILASQASDTGDNDRLFMDVPKTQQHTLKEIVHDPIQVIQSQIQGKGGKKLAATLSGTAIVHGADVQLVRAYDKVKETSNEEGKADALEEFDELKDNRQDSFVRWTMDHHVHKVKRIEKKTIQLPERKDFVTPREDSHVRFPWMDYAGHVRYLVPFKLPSASFPIRSKLEIILIEPIYSGCSRIRRILWRSICRCIVRTSPSQRRHYHCKRREITPRIFTGTGHACCSQTYIPLE